MIAPNENVEIRLEGRINAILVFGHYLTKTFSMEICKFEMFGPSRLRFTRSLLES